MQDDGRDCEGTLILLIIISSSRYGFVLTL
jgi:hypothetical protein